MDLAKHCELCENRVFDVLTGTTCSLTDQRPEFSNKCPEIRFESNHINKIKEVNIEYHKVALTKNLTIANFIVFLSTGIAVMAGGYLLGSFAWDKGVISTVPLIIIGVGFLIIPSATGPLVKYRQGMGVERNKKREMDELLASYNIEYDAEILIEEDMHGNKGYDAKLTFSRIHFR